MGIYFKVTPEELEQIKQRMETAGIHNMSAYIRRMCLEGGITRITIPELADCSRYLHAASNNLNQIARRVNYGGGYYPNEIDEISQQLGDSNRRLGAILEALSKI